MLQNDGSPKEPELVAVKLDEWERNQVVKSYLAGIGQDGIPRRVIIWVSSRVHSCSIGGSRNEARKRASVSGRILSRPTISSWKRRVSRYIATSACTRFKTCRSSRGNDWAAGAPAFNSWARKVYGGCMLSKCRGQER